MSITIRPYYRVLTAIWAILQIFTFAEAQEADSTIVITAGDKPRAEISGRFANGEERRNLSFLQSIAGAEGLGKRVSEVELTASDGAPVTFRKIQDGEYLAEAAIQKWKYAVDLTPPQNSALAHVSWIGPQAGILMFADLLPLTGKGIRSAEVKLELPANWSAHSTASKNSNGLFQISDIDGAVITVGTGFQAASVSKTSEGFSVDVSITGKWHFTPAEAIEMAGPILSEYKKLFRDGQPLTVQVNLLPFPRDTQFGTWQAETRGSTVTIVSSDMAFRTQSLQRLHEQLRHELFHIWIPNRLRLTGGYDWFYEGFALYQSLKTGVAVNRISFGDMLSTLSRAYAIDRRQTRRVSMIEASRNRWAAGSTELYARGMLIAFAADVEMMRSSGGKSSIEEIFRSVYSRHSLAASPQDGNEAILAIMTGRKELLPVVERYIKGSDAIDLADTLAAAGLEIAGDTISAMAKPGSRQKAILNRLGYNNWRKTLKYQNEK